MLAPQRDALKEQRAASGRSTVVAPVYVVILDHDDYENARKKGDIAWAKLMKKHPTHAKGRSIQTALRCKRERHRHGDQSRLRFLQGVSPRTEGEPRTFDAPHEHEDYTFDERDESGAMQTYHTSTYCTRPQERMRESWFRDRKLHGGRQYDEKKLEKQINEWNTQYAKFQKSKAELVVKANVLGVDPASAECAALRDAVRDLVWRQVCRRAQSQQRAARVLYRRRAGQREAGRGADAALRFWHKLLRTARARHRDEHTVQVRSNTERRARQD